MKRFLVCAAALLTLSAAVFGQGAPTPFVTPQYFNNSGAPNALGTLCTYLSGTSTPRATYSDASLTTPNQQCVPLNVAGRPSSGGIWLDPTVVYRFVLRDSTGVTLWTADGVTSSAGGSSALWTLSGSTISNSPGDKVCISSSSCTTALALLDVAGSSSGGNHLVRIDDATGSPGMDLYAAGASAGSITGDIGGLRLRASDGNIQMTVQSGGVAAANQNPSGPMTFTILAGGGQATANLFQIQTSIGVNATYADYLGRLVAPFFNATAATSSDLGFQLSNGLFQVYGDGRVNALVVNPLSYELNGTPIIDAAGNATVTSLTCTGTPCGSGGGGGGSPAGVTNSIQIKASPTSFGGDANFLYTQSTGVVELSGVGYVLSHGGFVTDGTATNIIQAPNGGILGQTLRTTDSVIWVEAAAPAASAAGQSRLYMDSTAHKLKLSQNTGSYFNVATSNGTLTNGNCASFDANGNVVDAGGPCTTGGGGGTVSASTQYAIAYYPSAGTTVGGSSNFQWNAPVQKLEITGTSTTLSALTVASGYIQTDGGFNTTSTSVNALQAAAGGVSALWHYVADSLFFAEEAAPALSAGGQSRVYMDNSTHTLKISQNGGAYIPLVGGAPGGANTNVQYNSTGAFAGSGNFTWNNAGQLLSVTAASSTNAGIAVATGFIQADQGFLATSGTATKYNAIQAPTAGVAALSGTFVNYVQVGARTTDPTVTTSDTFHAGTLYYNTASDCLMSRNNAGAFVCIGGGAPGSLPVVDSTSIVKGSSDATKQMRFNVGGLTTGTTRILSVQDGNYTLAGTDINQTISGIFTHSASILGTGSVDIGSAAGFFRDGYFSGAVEGQRLRTIKGNPGAVADYFDWYQDQFTNHILYLKDSSFNNLLLMDNTQTSVLRPIFNFYGDVRPDTNLTKDLGTASLQWNNLYAANVVISSTLNTPGLVSNGNIIVTGTGHGIAVAGGLTGSSTFGGIVAIAGDNGSNPQTGNLILNNGGAATGSTLTIKHGGTFDAAWNAGSSAAFDVVNSASSHVFVVDQAGHIRSLGSTPTVSGGCSISGTDNKGVISGCSGGFPITVTFANVWSSTPVCMVNGTNLTAGGGFPIASIGTIGTASFQMLTSNNGAGTYTFTYMCMQ